ncbi:hypothetical protein E2C01_055084 [Portunus trituberculatus]|uniref:Uncharacterized protein n=1 Tax=Portunus trituberculatus TaxID=210409 RepID=A0A5B7GLH6_PORTR|nr:hypothetical protein [Portunus trituberculatus]
MFSSAAPSSAGHSSPSSVVEDPVPGPSLVLHDPVAGDPSPVVPPSAPPGPPSEQLPPNIHELLSGILAHLSSAAPLPCARSSASPLVADPLPATPLPLSSPASQPYGMDSSPVSDAPPFGGGIGAGGSSRVMGSCASSLAGVSGRQVGCLTLPRWGLPWGGSTSAWSGGVLGDVVPLSSSFLAFSSPPSLSSEGEESTRLSMGLSGMTGQADQFLKVARDWSDQLAARAQSAPVPRLSPKPKTPLLPVGDSLDARVGVWLSARTPPSFPPPLATPSSETMRQAEKDKAFALDAFSSFQALLTAEKILTVLSLRQDLNTRRSQPFSWGIRWELPFGSTQMVADALARSPQVAVVYRGAPPGHAGSARARASSSRAAPPQYQGPSRFQRTSNRFLPYPSASRLAQSSLRDRRALPGRDGDFSTCRASGQQRPVGRGGGSSALGRLSNAVGTWAGRVVRRGLSWE